MANWIDDWLLNVDIVRYNYFGGNILETLLISLEFKDFCTKMKSLRGKYRRRKRSKYRMNCLLIDIGQYGVKVNNPDDILAHVFLVSIELPCSS